MGVWRHLEDKNDDSNKIPQASGIDIKIENTVKNLLGLMEAEWKKIIFFN